MNVYKIRDRQLKLLLQTLDEVLELDNFYEFKDTFHRVLNDIQKAFSVVELEYIKIHSDIYYKEYELKLHLLAYDKQSMNNSMGDCVYLINLAAKRNKRILTENKAEPFKQGGIVPNKTIHCTSLMPIPDNLIRDSFIKRMKSYNVKHVANTLAKSAISGIKHYKEFEKTMSEVKSVSYSNSSKEAMRAKTELNNELQKEIAEYCERLHEDGMPIINESGDQYRTDDNTDVIMSVAYASSQLRKSIELIKEKELTLDQRLKNIKERHQKVDEENQKRLDQLKAIEAFAHLMCSLFGQKTGYDLTGKIYIPKTY